MPVNDDYLDPAEEVRLLTRELVVVHARELGEKVIADGDRAFREERLAREEAEAKRAALSERMRALARLPRRGLKRPWQSLGISAAEWRARQQEE